MAREVNGYQLQQARKRWEMRRDIADRLFRESLYAFKDELSQKPTPQNVAEQYQKADFAVCKIEEIQQQFNAQTPVEVAGKRMTLALAVKLLSGADRLKKLWRAAATNESAHESRRYGYQQQLTRKADEEYAQRRVKSEEALKFCDQATQYAANLRAAIATANNKTIAVPNDVPAEIFAE
jgi:hypothetical protein